MRTHELALHLRPLCDFDRDWLDAVIPLYDGFGEEEKLKCIDNALSNPHTLITSKMRAVLEALKAEEENEEEEEEKIQRWQLLPQLPQGVRDSMKGVEPKMRLSALLSIAPAIGALSTGVKLDVHSELNTLNITLFLIGGPTSGKGKMDEIIDCWMYDIKKEANDFFAEEKEWRRRQRAKKKDAEGEEPPCNPVRYIMLNNTIANLVERLENTQGKHAFSFTSEADEMASSWKNTTVPDFSTLIRKAYDGAEYSKEAFSVDSATAHINKVLWNLVLCGTQDALFRVITNYTDDLQTRFCIARTPDNTFEALGKNYN